MTEPFVRTGETSAFGIQQYKDRVSIVDIWLSKYGEKVNWAEFTYGKTKVRRPVAVLLGNTKDEALVNLRLMAELLKTSTFFEERKQQVKQEDIPF